MRDITTIILGFALGIALFTAGYFAAVQAIGEADMVTYRYNKKAGVSELFANLGMACKENNQETYTFPDLTEKYKFKCRGIGGFIVEVK